MVLDQAVRLSADARVRFAALVHDLGKGTTPRAEWPAHHGHEERSVALIEALAARLRIPGDYRELAVIVARYHGIVHRAFELKPRTVLDFIERADALRRPERFGQALLACEADARGRTRPGGQALSAARVSDRRPRGRGGVKPSAEELAALRTENRRAAAPAAPRDDHRGARAVRTGARRSGLKCS